MHSSRATSRAALAVMALLAGSGPLAVVALLTVSGPLAVVALLAGSGPLAAEEPVLLPEEPPVPLPTAEERPVWIENGRESFESFCATCHGEDARGQGPLARLLTVRPADLTLCAARRGGTFPTDAIHARIDGTDEVTGHGSSDMPTWGRILTVVEDPDDPDERARVWRTVREVVLYLESIQEPGTDVEVR